VQSVEQPLRRRAWRTQCADGQVLVIFALLSMVLIGAVALSIDAGYLMAERRQTQSAADAAAMAAAQAVLDGKSSDVVQASGKGYGTQNANVPASNVTVESPSTTAVSHNGQYFVTVSITKDVSRFFVGAVYSGAWRVTAKATAGVDTTPADYALITLDKHDEPGIYMDGNTTIKLKGSQASAMSNTNIDSNGGTIFSVSGSIDAHDGVDSNANWIAPLGMHGGMPQVEDPITTAGVTSPWIATTPMTFPDCSSDCVLTPGTYTGNVTAKGKMLLLPGKYYFKSASISLQNTNSSFYGVGVQVYFDSNSSFDPKNGGVHLTVDATYPAANPARDSTIVKDAIVFWYASCSTLDMQGGGELFFQGIFYAPCALTKMHGNPFGDTVNGQVIVSQLDVRGTSDFGVTYTKMVQTYRPKIYLVE
jgi:Flp pilus assembly protein TadG